MSVYNILVSGPMFTKFFSPNTGWNVVDQVLFRFSTCRCVPEIFAIKVKHCTKSRWILDIFPPKFFTGQHPCKIIVHLITQASSPVPW